MDRTILSASGMTRRSRLQPDSRGGGYRVPPTKGLTFDEWYEKYYGRGAHYTYKLDYERYVKSRMTYNLLRDILGSINQAKRELGRLQPWFIIVDELRRMREKGMTLLDDLVDTGEGARFGDKSPNVEVSYSGTGDEWATLPDATFHDWSLVYVAGCFSGGSNDFSWTIGEDPCVALGTQSDPAHMTPAGLPFPTWVEHNFPGSGSWELQHWRWNGLAFPNPLRRVGFKEGWYASPLDPAMDPSIAPPAVDPGTLADPHPVPLVQPVTPPYVIQGSHAPGEHALPDPGGQISWPPPPPPPPPTRPPPGTVDIKHYASVSPASMMGKILNAITELADGTDAAWYSLPCSTRRQVFKDHGGFMTPQQRAAETWNHVGEIDVPKFLTNLALNNAIDYFSGRLNKISGGSLGQSGGGAGREAVGIRGLQKYVNKYMGVSSDYEDQAISQLRDKLRRATARKRVAELQNLIKEAKQVRRALGAC